MRTYDIFRITTCRERHSVEAADPQEALHRFALGDASLRDDEVIGVDKVRVQERGSGRDVTAEAEGDAAEGPWPG